METPRRSRKRQIKSAVEKSLRRIRQKEPSQNLNFQAEHGIQMFDNPVDKRDQASGNPDPNSVSLDSSVVELELRNFDLAAASGIETLNECKSKMYELAHWAISHNITHDALRNLLKLLRKWYPDERFPIDPRTLLRTPRELNLEFIDGGEYYYFGIQQQVEKQVRNGLCHYRLPLIEEYDSVENLITLTIGVDGLPISRSSNKQFWPILAILDQAMTQKPFVISLFYGNQKPSSVEEFLRAFIEEMAQLESTGISVNDRSYNIRIRCIIADAPARSFLKCTKNHNAYYGCERCYRKGKWRGRVIYPT